MSISTAAGDRTQFDVVRAIDDGHFTPLQKLVYLLAALAIVLDGFDGQMIGYAIPAIMKEWGIPRAAFSVAVACGLFGMAVGSLVAGVIADKIGRKPVLIGSILLFGTSTAMIASAADVSAIAAIRFFAGIGIGAALPACTTLLAEFTPTRSRTMAVTTAIVCYPLGGMLAGLVAGKVLPVEGWRTFFLVGGTIPVVYALVLIFQLKESPKYLARQASRVDDLRALMSGMRHDVSQVAEFTDGGEGEVKRGSVGALFKEGRTRDTLWLWVAFFMTQLSLYSAFSWLPTMLTTEGLSPALAGMGLTAYNFGGVFGAVLCALAMNRFGSRWPMVIWAAMSALSAFALKAVSVADDTQMFMLGLGVHGLFITALQCALYTLCAHLYPTLIRVTGTAMALSIGRTGAILSSFVGAAMITAGGSVAYLNLLGGTMIVTVVALALVRNHFARR